MGRRLADAWPTIAELYWCEGINVPMIGPECPGGGRGQRVRLTEPGDARPAFDHDIELIRGAYTREAGRSGFSEFIGSGVIMLNKVPFMDLMYEVISEGVVIARVYYDVSLGSWRLRFSLPGLKRVWHREPLNLFRVRGGIRTLRRTRIFKNTKEYNPGEQIALVNDDYNPIGIAYVSDDGEVLKVHTVFWRDTPASRAAKRETTWDDVVKANDYYIYYHWSRAVKFIHVMNEKVRKPVIVSYSGGKDSLVSLHLTLEAGIKPYLLFNDTGIEMPETYEQVRKIADDMGLELLVAGADDRFWRTVTRVGPPGKDYRWCCKVAKLAPLARLLLERFPDGALNVVGQRAYESIDRARSPRVWRNRWIPLVLNISPIQYWTQLTVWLYIWKYKLPYNPLYEKGFDRIGCYLCPSAFTAEYEFVEQTHPNLWRRWERFLKFWAERIGLKDEDASAWIKKGLWRWLTPAPQKLRLARRAGVVLPEWREQVRRWINPPIGRYEEAEDGVIMLLLGELNPSFMKEQYAVLGDFTLDEDRDRVTARSPSGTTLIVSKDKLVVKGAAGVSARELLLDTLKAHYRWSNCSGCRLCETSCPTGAIRVTVNATGDNRPIVDPSKCIHCKLCLDNCPLADVVADRLYSAMIIGSPTAWRRQGRRTHESVISRYLKLKGFRVPEVTPMQDYDPVVIPEALRA